MVMRITGLTAAQRSELRASDETLRAHEVLLSQWEQRGNATRKDVVVAHLQGRIDELQGKIDVQDREFADAPLKISRIKGTIADLKAGKRRMITSGPLINKLKRLRRQVSAVQATNDKVQGDQS